MLEIEIIEVSVTQMGFALLLKPPTHEKVVPIFIGPLETYSISSALEGQKFERPLTHDLLKTILDSIDYEIEKIFIDDFRGGTFFAKLFLISANNKKIKIEIDSRPSDAIAIALRFRAPIYMAEQVYEQTAIDVELLKEKVSQAEPLIDEEAMGDDEKDELIQSIIDEFGDPPTSGFETQKQKKSEEKSIAPNFKSQKDVLKQMLVVAIKNEKYEEAARLRDEIRKFEAKGASAEGGKKSEITAETAKNTEKRK